MKKVLFACAAGILSAALLTSCASSVSVKPPIYGTDQCENVIIMEAVMFNKIGGAIAAAPMFKKRMAPIEEQINQYNTGFSARLAKLYSFCLNKIMEPNIIILPAEEILGSNSSDTDTERASRVKELFAGHNAQMLIIPVVTRKTSAAVGFDGVYGMTDITIVTYIYSNGIRGIGSFTTYTSKKTKIKPADIEDWQNTLDASHFSALNIIGGIIYNFPQISSPELLRELFIIRDENTGTDKEAIRKFEEMQNKKFQELRDEIEVYWEQMKTE